MRPLGSDQGVTGGNRRTDEGSESIHENLHRYEHPHKLGWVSLGFLVRVCVGAGMYARAGGHSVRSSVYLPCKVASTDFWWAEQAGFFISLFAPEKLVSRDGFDSPVFWQPLILHTK